MSTRDLAAQLVATCLTPPPVTWRDIMGPWKPVAAQEPGWWITRPGEQPGRLIGESK